MLRINRAAPTPESFWSYKPATATPSLDEALAIGAISQGTTEDTWQSLTPGMRREIVRSTLKRNA